MHGEGILYIIYIQYFDNIISFSLTIYYPPDNELSRLCTTNFLMSFTGSAIFHWCGILPYLGR